jgi:hypothetical protein
LALIIPFFLLFFRELALFLERTVSQILSFSMASWPRWVLDRWASYDGRLMSRRLSAPLESSGITSKTPAGTITLLRLSQLWFSAD